MVQPPDFGLLLAMSTNYDWRQYKLSAVWFKVSVSGTACSEPSTKFRCRCWT